MKTAPRFSLSVAAALVAVTLSTPSFADFTITKTVDKSSPTLAQGGAPAPTLSELVGLLLTIIL